MNCYEATKYAAQTEMKITDLPDEILNKITKHVGSSVEELQPVIMAHPKFMETVLTDHKFVLDILHTEHQLGIMHHARVKRDNEAGDNFYHNRCIIWEHQLANYITDFVNRTWPDWRLMEHPPGEPYNTELRKVRVEASSACSTCGWHCVHRCMHSKLMYLNICMYLHPRRRSPTTSWRTPDPPGDPGPRPPTAPSRS